MIGDNYSKVVSRNYTNQSEVKDAGLPSSAFDLSYVNKTTAIIGHLLPISYQHLLWGTKYNGSHKIDVTYDQTSTPEMPKMLHRVHNFVVPDFSVNADFRDLVTPNPSNNYNKDATIGAFKFSDAYNYVLSILVDATYNISYYDFISNFLEDITLSGSTYTVNTGSTLEDMFDNNGAKLKQYLSNIFLPNVLNQSLYDSIYCHGVMADLYNQIMSYLPATITGTMNLSQYNAIAYAVIGLPLKFFFGEGSVCESLGYPYIDNDLLRNFSSIRQYYYLVALNDLPSTLLWASHNSNDVLFSDTVLRKYQAIWIEFYRNVQIQKLTSVLNYHKWDNSNSVASSTAFAFMMFIPRLCPWNEDMFTSAQLDDIMRRVYVPVVDENAEINNPSPSLTATSEYNNHVLGTRYMTVQDISYLDNNGVSKTVHLPIPSLLNRALSQISYSNPDEGALSFDLFSLKRAHMLERFLKRSHFFGDDEYRDYIKGQYGVDLSDLRLNRPKFLGGATSIMTPDVHISQSGSIGSSGSGTFGSRVTTASGELNGDSFTDFCEECCSVISLFSVIPEVQYDPLCIQNTQVFVSQFPVPVLCQDMESIIPVSALTRSNISDIAFGHAPSAYQYRSRVNEVHGKYLSVYSGYTSARFFGIDPSNTPKLNSSFLECRPVLDYFVNAILLDGQMRLRSENNFYVEASLPAPVEVI